MLHGIYKNKWKIDIPDYNGDDSWQLPMPATYLVLPEGRRINFALVDIDFTQRADPKLILKALKDSEKPLGMAPNDEEEREERRRRRAERKKRKEEERKRQELEQKERKAFNLKNWSLPRLFGTQRSVAPKTFQVN